MTPGEQQLYQPTRHDITTGQLQVQCSQGWAPTHGTFTLEGEEQPREPLLSWANRRLVSAKTNGDGACSMHAVFGRPHRHELFCESARQIIVAAFAKGYTMAGTREHIDVLISGWWAELRAAIVSDTYKHNEVGMLWHTLDEPMKKQCKDKATEGQRSMQGKERERRRLFTQACRDFFTSDVEKTVVRPVAATFGHIPENENVLKMSEDELSTLYKGNPDSWLQPAFEQVGSSKRVRGNYQVEFPSDGPKSKYAALFDSNPCFDPLRVAFVEEHTPQRMREALRQVLSDSGGQPWERGLAKVIHAIEQFEATALQVGEPPLGFADIIWTSYLKVLANPNYFLSTDELNSGCHSPANESHHCHETR